MLFNENYLNQLKEDAIEKLEGIEIITDIDSEVVSEINTNFDGMIVNYANGDDKRLPHYIRAKLRTKQDGDINYTIKYNNGKTYIGLGNPKTYSNSKKKQANDNIMTVGALSAFGEDEIKGLFNAEPDTALKVKYIGPRFKELSKDEKRKYYNKVVIER